MSRHAVFRVASLVSLALSLGAGLFAAGCGDAGLDVPEAAQSVEQSAVVCATGKTLQGIDVSVYQGTIDWAQVAASGRAFAFVKATDGSSTVDSKFARNWSESKKNGLIRGAYHFFRAAQDATAQANLVVNTIGMLQPGDLPVVIDVELAGGQSAADILASIHTWVDIVE